jgi:hypothetical protein
MIKCIYCHNDLKLSWQKKFCSRICSNKYLDNLITLCSSCHGIIEANLIKGVKC